MCCVFDVIYGGSRGVEGVGGGGVGGSDLLVECKKEVTDGVLERF